MSLQFTDPVVNGTTLVREAIRSPDYVTGAAGWSINADGSAEFNAGAFRGTVVIGPDANDVTIKPGLTPELATFYGGGAFSIAGAMMQFTAANVYSYLVWGHATTGGTPFLAMGGVDPTGHVEEVWNLTGPPAAGATEFNLFRQTTPAGRPATVNIGGHVGAGTANLNDVLNLLMPNINIGTLATVHAPGVTFDLSASGTINVGQAGGVNFSDDADITYAGVHQPRGLVSRNTAAVDSATFGTAPFTALSTPAPGGVWPDGRAYEVRYAEQIQAVSGTPRVSTWISGGTVSTTTLYDGGSTPPISGTPDEHSGIMRFNVNTPGLTSSVFLRHNVDAGSAVSLRLGTPALRWIEVWDIGSSADYPDLVSMV